MRTLIALLLLVGTAQAQYVEVEIWKPKPIIDTVWMELVCMHGSYRFIYPDWRDKGLAEQTFGDFHSRCPYGVETTWVTVEKENKWGNIYFADSLTIGRVETDIIFGSANDLTLWTEKDTISLVKLSHQAGRVEERQLYILLWIAALTILFIIVRISDHAKRKKDLLSTVRDVPERPTGSRVLYGSGGLHPGEKRGRNAAHPPRGKGRQSRHSK